MLISVKSFLLTNTNNSFFFLCCAVFGVVLFSIWGPRSIRISTLMGLITWTTLVVLLWPSFTMVLSSLSSSNITCCSTCKLCFFISLLDCWLVSLTYWHCWSCRVERLGWFEKKKGFSVFTNDYKMSHFSQPFVLKHKAKDLDRHRDNSVFVFSYTSKKNEGNMTFWN